MSATLSPTTVLSDVEGGRGVRGELSYGRFFARSSGGEFDVVVVNPSGALCWREDIDRNGLKRLLENATDIETGRVDDVWRTRWLGWSG